MFEYLLSHWQNCLERIGGIALLEDVCHWGQTLGFQKPETFPVSSPTFVYGTTFKLSSTVPMPCLPAPMIFTMMFIDSETVSHQYIFV